MHYFIVWTSTKSTSSKTGMVVLATMQMQAQTFTTPGQRLRFQEGRFGPVAKRPSDFAHDGCQLSAKPRCRAWQKWVVALPEAVPASLKDNLFHFFVLRVQRTIWFQDRIKHDQVAKGQKSVEKKLTEIQKSSGLPNICPIAHWAFHVIKMRLLSVKRK